MCKIILIFLLFDVIYLFNFKNIVSYCQGWNLGETTFNDV